MNLSNDEIVSDLITLIHSSTQSSYVTCSKLTSKIFSYLSQIPFETHPWNDLQTAIEQFDQSFDHPDLCRFRELVQTLSNCANDSEERNYSLGRDRTILMNSIEQLQDLLKSHVDLHCFILKKLIEKDEIRSQLIDLMNLTGMNVGYEVHGRLCHIIHLLIQIDRRLASTNVIDHPIVLHCLRLIQSRMPHIYSKDDHNASPVTSALLLLTDLLLTNETFPVHSYSKEYKTETLRSNFFEIKNQYLDQLSNCVFLKTIFEYLESKVDDDDELVLTSIRFLLAFNLRFDYPHKNPIMLTLLAANEQLSCRTLIDRLILLFNRGIDPIEHSGGNSVVKFFSDLYGENGTLSDILLSEADRRLIIEIISRELSNRTQDDHNTVAYLSLLELILRNQKLTEETCPRINELQTCFRWHLYDEQCSQEVLFIINEILQQHPWLSTNDMPFHI